MADEVGEVKVEIEETPPEKPGEESEVEPVETNEDVKLTKGDIEWIRQQRQKNEATNGESNPPAPERIARLEVEQPPAPLIENPLADRTDKTPRRNRQQKRKRIVKVLKF